MTYIVVMGVNYEGFGLPSYAGNDAARAREIFQNIADNKDDYFYDSLYLVTYSEHGLIVGKEIL